MKNFDNFKIWQLRKNKFTNMHFWLQRIFNLLTTVVHRTDRRIFNRKNSVANYKSLMTATIIGIVGGRDENLKVSNQTIQNSYSNFVVKWFDVKTQSFAWL